MKNRKKKKLEGKKLGKNECKIMKERIVETEQN